MRHWSKIKLLLPIWFLLVSSLVWAQLAPQQVAKNAQVDVPPGMHLVTDSTGNRWLLPEDMDEPPEREVQIKYFKTSQPGQPVRKIGTHVVLNAPINALDAVVSTNANDSKNLMRRLPKVLIDLFNLEKFANLHAAQSPDLQSLGVFGPAQQTTFKVPYIPMPVEEFEFAAVSDYASADTRALVSYTEGGKAYYRMFIHPNYVDSYKELIAKYGIVYHYDGMSSSSPRSLIVMDPDHPDQVHWVKVSLHRKIDGSVRINTDKKARRAILMSEAINGIPKSVLKSYGLSFMLEPAAFQPRGKISSTIVREVAPELMSNDPNIRWIPAFILQNTGADAVPGLNLQDMITASGMEPGDFVREKVVRPLLRSYLAMGLKEGLPGELHTQNFYYKLQKTATGWQPTGEVMFKDNDGFRYDTELAMRNGRPLGFFAKFSQPFFWGKFSNTLGLGSEGIPFLGSWYYKLIRNVNGFETLSAYMMRALQTIDPANGWAKDNVQLMFDDVAAQEAEKLTGVHIERSDYGYGYSSGLNKILNIWRAKLSGVVPTGQRADANLQALLQSEFNRLRGVERVSSLRRSIPQDAYYILHESPDHQYMIEARTPRTTIANPDPTIGFAMVERENDANGAAFRSNVQPYLSEAVRDAQLAPSNNGSQQNSLHGAGLRCESVFGG